MAIKNGEFEFGIVVVVVVVFFFPSLFSVRLSFFLLEGTFGIVERLLFSLSELLYERRNIWHV